MNGKNWGVEFKYLDAPRRTKSMTQAIQDLELSHLWVVYPGSDQYPIDTKITAIPLSKISYEQMSGSTNSIDLKTDS